MGDEEGGCGVMGDYGTYLESKRERARSSGFDPLWMPDWLFDFQRHLTEWVVRLGKGALFADCGLGKGPMQLVWAENVVRKTNKPVLIVAPLAVSQQFVREGEKFGVGVHRSRDGILQSGINVTNYERLHRFDPAEVAGLSCDESGVLKHFDTKTKEKVSAFASGLDYRLLASATPAPNDFMELGNSSEVLGGMSRVQMLGMFFSHRGDSTQQWELKGHARRVYWRWVAGWARAMRMPSDFGYEDGDFTLPPLRMVEHVLPSSGNGRGFFFFGSSLNEQRAEKRASLDKRCEKVAELVPVDRSAVVWCHYNAEGDLLEKLIPGAVQVAGRHSDEAKEERLTGFSTGQIRVLVTKPRIGGWGLNWQHCSDVFCFPSHSYEAFYQTIRRCWRFGQRREVVVNLVATEAERPIMGNMLRKERQVVQMFRGIIEAMHDHQVGAESSGRDDAQRIERPGWLSE